MQQNRRCTLFGDRDEMINKRMQKINAKRVQDWTRVGGQGDPLRIVQKSGIWPYQQEVYAQPGICPEEWDAQNFLAFWDTNRSPNPGQTTDLIRVNKKREPAE